MLKYAAYMFGSVTVIFWSYAKYYNKSPSRICIDCIMMYCRLKKRIEKYKTYLKTIYRSNMILLRRDPPDDVFYYKNSKIISSTTILNLIIGSYVYRSEYDFITYELTNENGEKICKIFDDQTEMLKEFVENRQIVCNPSSVQIISALLIINRNSTDEFYDVSPKGLGIDIEGNRLYSFNFINYFFNINPGRNYKVKITDSNINEFLLVNNLHQQQIISIKHTCLKVETIPISKNDRNISYERLIGKLIKQVFVFIFQWFK